MRQDRRGCRVKTTEGIGGGATGGVRKRYREERFFMQLCAGRKCVKL